MSFLPVSLAAGTSWAARFVDNGDGTVTDTQTGLMWQQADNGTTQTWYQALSYCDRLVLGGHDDWRLPRIDELETIINYATFNPTSFDPPFITSVELYWSGSTPVGYPDDAWIVYFCDGFVYAQNKTDGYYVRCVRGGHVDVTVLGGL